MLKREKLKVVLGKNNGHQSIELTTAPALKIKDIPAQGKAAPLSTLQSHEFGLSAEVKSVYLKVDSTAHANFFQTGWFVVGLQFKRLLCTYYVPI